MKIPIGTILVNSIGCGCDVFHQVIRSTEKTVTAQEIESKVVSRNLRAQSCVTVPNPGHFRAGEKARVLRIAPDGRIGPIQRMIWWSVWKGAKLPQYSP